MKRIIPITVTTVMVALAALIFFLKRLENKRRQQLA